jgi:hypothetical protein
MSWLGFRSCGQFEIGERAARALMRMAEIAQSSKKLHRKKMRKPHSLQRAGRPKERGGGLKSGGRS